MMIKKKLDDLDAKTQEAVVGAFEKEGVSKEALQEEEFEISEDKSHITFSFRGVSVSIPAPSQGVIDRLWQDHSHQIITTLLTLAAVFVGAAISKNAQKDNSDA